jgi:exosortase C (VPDSG-CTERM-specific)
MNLETSRPNPDLSAEGAASRAPVSAEPFVPSWRRFKGLAIFSGLVILAFAKPLLMLLAFAPHQELFAHILLIPFVSGYLIWIQRKQFVPESKPNRGLALLPFIVGAVVLMAYRIALSRGVTFAKPDYLAVMMFAFLCFLTVGAFLFVGASYFKSISFPVAFLIFIIPFPVSVRDGLETFFQHGSAMVAYWMLSISGMPVLRDVTYFKMPAFQLNVGPECSGIHSSLILFITSLLAAYIFLRTPVRRGLFVVSVIPLALLRNGFRVFCLGELGVHYDPLILDTAFHHHGGPLFFLLSLVPLFFLLSYLIKSEVRKEPARAVRTK